MLELWKPLIVRAKTHKPVICDVFGEKLKKPYRPFVIFYDDNEDCYYYLRARGTTGIDENGKEYFLNPKKYEVFVHQSEHPEEELFQINSYVDCSQIFKCNRETLESLVDVNADAYTCTSVLENKYITEIKNNIFKAINEIPPYLSIIEVFENKNTNSMEYKSLYLNKEIFDNENKTSQNRAKFNYDFYKSINDVSDKYSFDRYNTGIRFCEMFLVEYFPNELQEFKKVQGLEQTNPDKEGFLFNKEKMFYNPNDIKFPANDCDEWEDEQNQSQTTGRGGQRC